jgi:hypothetical protein
MIVPRAQLTVTERGAHVRRLRKTRKLSKQPMAFSEADALEAETIDLILSGNLLLTAQERAKSGLIDDAEWLAGLTKDHDGSPGAALDKLAEAP